MLRRGRPLPRLRTCRRGSCHVGGGGGRRGVGATCALGASALGEGGPQGHRGAQGTGRGLLATGAGGGPGQSRSPSAHRGPTAAAGDRDKGRAVPTSVTGTSPRPAVPRVGLGDSPPAGPLLPPRRESAGLPAAGWEPQDELPRPARPGGAPPYPPASPQSPSPPHLGPRPGSRSPEPAGSARNPGPVAAAAGPDGFPRRTETHKARGVAGRETRAPAAPGGSPEGRGERAVGAGRGGVRT